MAERAKRRIPPQRTSEKLAISLPIKLVEAARTEAKARHSPSLSAFIAEAVEEKLEKDDLQRVLDEIFGDHPITDEERKWAYGLLMRR